ncbi:MAG: helix-turn-helix domain-containing protein [Myxococcota bacterium]|nr:helix-turn-helix domain-containing protein [Myxococcota bacterium]
MEAWLVDGKVDLQTGLILREGHTSQQLSTLALACVRYLAQSNGCPVSREDLLVEVWGYRRGVRSRAVDTTVKVIRRLVEQDPGAPAHLHTVRGVGYRWEGAPVPARPQTSLIGRHVTQARLHASTEAIRVVTGPPGVGKTALGSTLSWPRIDLQGCSLAGSLQRIGSVLLPGRGPHTLQTIAAHLQGDAPAIWLDHPEALGEPFARQVSELVSETGLRVLVTTRDIRGWSGQIIRLAPLPSAEARALLERTWGDGDPAVISRMMPALDGLPLTLVLAGAALKRLPPSALLSAGHCWSAMLVDGEALAGVLETSWALLEPEAVRGLALLALLEGTFSLEEATGLLQRPASPLIAELLTRSLVEVDEAGQYHILRSIRNFALDQAQPDARAAAHDALVRWLATRCKAAGLLAYRTLAARQTDLEHALEWARDDAHVGALIHALASFHYFRGDSDELLRLVLRAGTLSSPRWRRRLELWRLLDFCGRGHAVLVLPELALMTADLERDDLHLQWFFHAVQLRARLLTEDATGALQSAQVLVSLGTLIGDASMVGRAWADVALCAGRAGQHEAARSACDRALILLRVAGNIDQLARVKSIEGRLMMEAGCPEAAAGAFREALRTGPPRLEALIRLGLGRALAAIMQREAAEHQFQEAARLAALFSDENTRQEAEAALAGL